jgi:diacylglycerol kinase (ATP)
MLVLLRNTNAGKKRNQITSKELLHQLGARGHLIETHSLEGLSQAAKDVAHASPSLIAIWGGDGTITATVSALLKVYQARALPPLCLLPGGTMNVVSRSLRIHGRAEEAFGRLTRRFYQGDPMPLLRRTLLRFEDQYGFLFGVGLLANFLEALYEGNQSGTLRSAYVLGRACVESLWGGGLIPKLFQPFEAKLTVDGKVWPQSRWVNISAGGVEGLGLGFRPYIRCAEREGSFHLIGHDLQPLGVVRELPNIQLGRGMKQVVQDVVREFLIEPTKPMVYSIEGELYEARERFLVTSGPTVQLIVP